MKVLLLPLLVALPLLGDVVTYPNPGLTGSESAQASTFWSTSVVQSGATNASFAYQILSQKLDTNPHTNTTFTTFSASGTSTLLVTRLFAGSMTNVSVFPSSYGLTASVSSGTNISVSMPDPGTGKHFAVIPDNDWSHPLLVFAEPLETSVPSPTDPGVKYFAPGIYDIGSCFSCVSGQTIYLAGGAYVKGKIVASGSTGATIRGRGILSGENYSHDTTQLYLHGMVTHDRCTNFLAEGITIIQPPGFSFSTSSSSSGNVLRNVKVMGWYYNTDFSTGVSLIEDCFFKVNDTGINLFLKNSEVRRCVAYQMENGAPFDISWQLPGGANITNVFVHDCDIIKTSYSGFYLVGRASFGSRRSESSVQHDYRFEDIRIENANLMLFSITTQDALARLYDFSFTNIVATNCVFGSSNELSAFSAGMISNFVFQGLKINGTNVTNAALGSFNLVNATNIVFLP